MQPLVITFAFDEDAQALSVTPERVALGSLREFAKDVEDFLRGDDKEIDCASLTVAVVDGSFGLRTEPIALAPSLVRDLALIASTQTLDVVSERRRNILLGWQKRARGARRQRFRIEATNLASPLRVDASTDYRSDDADQWVRVERYMRGEVVEVGGARSVNAHIKLPNGITLAVDATREQLRDDRANRLYKPAMVRFSADFNVITSQYRGAKLIAFEEYEPKFDEKSFSRLTDRGARAWADVDDAAQWVEGLRGS
jgi:hypothetical protein